MTSAQPEIKSETSSAKEDRLDALFNPHYKAATIAILMQTLDRMSRTDTFKHACERGKLEKLSVLIKNGEFHHMLFAVMWMLKQDGEFHNLVRSGSHRPRFELFMRMLDEELPKALQRTLKEDGTLYYVDMHVFVFQMVLSYAKRYDPYGEFEAHYGKGTNAAPAPAQTPPSSSSAAAAAASQPNAHP